MDDGLTSDQRALSRAVAHRHGASPQLLDSLHRSDLHGDNRVSLADMVTEDLAERGFDKDYRPTDLGRQLEDLIDALNARDPPRLRRLSSSQHPALHSWDGQRPPSGND